MLDKLWNDIRLIYEGLYFRKRMLMDNLMIISEDNYYLLYYSPSGETTTQIRIEKNYSLVNMWSDNKEVDITDFNIYVNVGDKVEIDDKHKIELTYKIITPLLRQVKLNKIGV